MIVSGNTTGIYDNDTGWSISTVPAISTIKWSVNLSWDSVSFAYEYAIDNSTNTSTTTTGSTSASDNGTWTGGTTTATPTSANERSTKSDGDIEVTDSDFGIILHDTANSDVYRLQVTSGTLTLTLI